MTASITELLCQKLFGRVPFGRVPDVYDPHFSGIVCNLACSTKQQLACNSCPLEALGDDLRELLLMVGCVFPLLSMFFFILLSTYLFLFIYFLPSLR